jgi:disulfide bond formation protein DsbB
VATAAVSRPAFGGSSRAAIARLIAILLPLSLLAGAYGSQYFGGLFPCEMCWWQRYAHMAALLPAALAFTAPATSDRARDLTVLAAIGIAVSGAIGVYHAGVELHIFQGFTTCTTTAKAATTQELLQKLMHVPLIRCDQVQWSFLGISMAGWNAILSLSGAAAILYLVATGRRRA